MSSFLLDYSKMVPSSEAGRNFGEVLNRVKESGEIYITRNNNVDAVLVDIETYARLRELQEVVEHLEVAGLIAERRDEPEAGTLDQLLAGEAIRLGEK